MLETSILIISFWIGVLLLQRIFPEYLNKKHKLYILNFALVFLFITSTAIISDRYVDYKIDQLDEGHDGFYPAREDQTPELKYYLDRKFNDLGRNLAPFWGIVFGTISTILLAIILKFLGWIGIKRFQ